MSSFYAELTVGGQSPYPLRQCQFEFTQATDQRGRAAAKVRHGLLHLTLDVPEDDQLLDWANTVHKPLAGHVTFFEDDHRTARETLSFAAGQCVSYHESFVAGDREAGAYVCQLIITSAGLSLTPGGPAAAFVAPAARDSAAPIATAAPAALPAATSPVAPWHDELTTLMGPTVDVPTAVAAWVAGGLSEPKLQAAFQGATDKKLVFERLQDAKKGIYQQRVVIDDYDNIPGISNAPYVANGLAADTIPATLFGVADSDYDLPMVNAPTFTNSAVLVELKPGDKLYRVTNDPTISKYAKTGGYWTRTPPTQLADVISGTAVMPEWNNFQKVYELTVPAHDPTSTLPKMYAWEGPTAAQPVSGIYPEKKHNGYSLLGGDPQVFLTENITHHDDFADHIKDITSTHKSW